MNNLERHFLLTFGMEAGGTRTVRVNHVNSAVTNSMMRGAMEDIIESGALYGVNGVAAIARRALMVTRTITPIELPI